ncbi:MAG: hypothetical protein HOW59_00480, partial [Nonomuraea sp.]|nr:hypothetical protein [Nonomuraea sp.]
MTRPGDADRPYVGTSYEDRPQITMTYRGGGSGQQYDYQADNIEDAYADHLVDHGKSTYPGMDPQAPATPTAPADPQGKELLAAHPINPGSAKKELFVDLDTYEDPATGNPRPTSPVEKLRQDLDRLQGAA